MNVFKKSVAAVAIASASALSAPTVHAGFVDSFFDDVWVQTSDGGAYETQRRGGWVGGSTHVRIPNRSVSVLSLTAPRLEAGCGGVDMTFGAFGFIDGDEIIQLLKTIGQQAKALLFQIAIDTINQMLGNLMKEFQQKVQSLNEMFKNSCDIAEGIVQGVKDPQEAIANVTKKWEERRSIANGAKTEWDRIKSEFTDPMAALKKAMASTETRKKNPGVHNAVVSAALATRSTAGMMYGFSTVTGSSEANGVAITMLMNMTGTMLPPPSTSCNAGDLQSVGATSSKACSQQFVDVPPTITKVSDLMNPGGLEINVCADAAFSEGSWKTYMSNMDRSECTTLRKAKMSVMFPGTKAMVNHILFGVKKADATQAEKEASSRGIVAFLQGRTGANKPTDEEIRFLNSTPLPVMGSLMRVQRSPAAMFQVANMMSDIIAADFAVTMADDMVRSAVSTFSGANPQLPPKPANFDKNVDGFRNSLEVTRTTVSEKAMMQTMLDLHKLTEIVYSSLIPQPVARGSSR